MLRRKCGFSACSAMNLKLYNWHTLDERVFGKLGCALPPSERRDCASARPGAIERVLRLLQRLLLDKGLLPEVSGPSSLRCTSPVCQLLPQSLAWATMWKHLRATENGHTVMGVLRQCP